VNGWLVRDARPADAPALGWIHVESWRAAYRGIVADDVLDALDSGRRGREWLGWISEPHGGRFLVVERLEDGAIGGVSAVSSYRPNPDAVTDELAGQGWGEVRLFYLDPMVWGSGAGDDLLEASHAALAQLGYPSAALWVFEANPRARRFYERHGWADDGARLAFAIGDRSVMEARYRRALGGARPPL
jgi:GNAT superfamily N-acetyltransferase